MIHTLAQWLRDKLLGPANPPKRRTRLGFETLDRREVPASFWSTPLYGGVDRWDANTALRGVMITPQTLANYNTPDPAYDNRAPRDILRGWRVNLLRVEIVADPVGDVTPDDPARYDQQLRDYRAWLDGQIAMIKSAEPLLQRDGISIIIDMHDPIGGPVWGQTGSHQVFTDSRVGNQFVADWGYLATRFNDRLTDSVVVGLDLMNEASVPMAGPRPTAAEAKPWNDLALRSARAVRATGALNTNRTLVIESIGGNPDLLSQLRPGDFRGPVVFSFHFYDKERINETLDRVRRWQRNNGVRVYVGEFSSPLSPSDSITRKREAASYLKTLTDKFESYGWDWTYHAFREAPVWDLEKNFGGDRDLWNRSNLKARWSSNARLFS